MNPHLFVTVVFPCVAGAMAMFFFAVGLRGIVGRKPFVISSRWLMAFVLIGFAPGMLHPFAFAGPPGSHSSGMLAILLWVNPLVFAVLAVFIWLSLRGYTVFAVTDSSFREGLLASLKKLDLPYEETLASVRLPSVGADVQAAVQSWMGIGQLKMKERQFNGLLVDIVHGMNEYYQTSTVPVNLTSCIFYVVMGVLLLVLAGALMLAVGRIV